MSVYFNDKRGKWLYNFERGGRRYSAYCVDERGQDVTTKRAAKACEARIKRDVEKALKTIPRGVVVSGAYTVEQMFADYVTQHAGQLRSWRTNMRRYVEELLEFFGRATAASALSVEDVERFIAHSRAQPRAVYVGGPRKGGELATRDAPRFRTDSTTNRYLTTLRAAANWAVAHGKMPALKVRHLEEPADLPNPVSLDQVRAILGHALPHLRLAILIAVHTGMRLDETLGLRWDWIDTSAQVIRLPSRTTKAKVGQVVHINAELAKVLVETPRVCDWVVAYRQADGCFRPIKTLRHAWLTAQRAAGISPPHRFHDLRATFCTAVLAANNNPLTLKAAARHASLSTTMRYAQVADDSVREAFNATLGLGQSQTEVANASAGQREPSPKTGDKIEENQG
ncbi:MAG: tyrosine-type recombinase/integrase [Bacteroidota bacterium]